MTLRRKPPSAQQAPKAPTRKPKKAVAKPLTGTALMREKFVREYLRDNNGTQAAIRAGYSPRTAKQMGSQLLTRVDISRAVAAQQEKLLKPITDRYLVNAERITRELALLGFSNMGDYGHVDDEGEFRINLANTDRDALAAIHTIKTKRTIRTIGDIDIEETATELRLAPKREALVDLGKVIGLFKDGVDATMQVRFFVQLGTGPTFEPYPDEEQAA